MNIQKIFEKRNKFDIFCSEVKEKKFAVIIYGVGSYCAYFLLPAIIKSGIIPQAICDGNERRVGQSLCVGEKHCFTIRSLQDVLQEFKTIKVIIGSAEHSEDIKSTLCNFFSKDDIYDNFFCYESLKDMEGFKQFLISNEERLMRLYNDLEDKKSKKVLENVLYGRTLFDYSFFTSIFEENQYFPNQVVDLSNNEVFIDAGAYDGDTLRTFLEHTEGQFNKYYAFEPNEELYRCLQEKQERDARIVCIKKAVGKEKKEAFLLDKAAGSGFVMEENEHDASRIQVIDLDELEFKNVTYIKMDIEGSEMDALIGATELIKRCRPKLAICIYHKYTDILEIPEYIRSLNLDYKLYMRHHSKIYSETVLYAI